MLLKPPPGVTLRPYLLTDAPALQAIFEDAVMHLTEDDYDDDQRQAWASMAADVDGFATRLASMITLVALQNGEIAAFASLVNNDRIEYLYTSPRFARRGIATYLCGAMETLAQARKATLLQVSASDTAQLLFAKRGFVATQRNSVFVQGEWLASSSMQKPISPEMQSSGH